MAKISKKNWLYGCIALFLGGFGAYKSYYLYQNHFYPHRFDRYESNEQATLALNKVFPTGTKGDDVRKTLESDGYKCSQKSFIEAWEKQSSPQKITFPLDAKYVFTCYSVDIYSDFVKSGVTIILDSDTEVLELIVFGSFGGL